MSHPVSVALWLYRTIARAFPRKFRDSYGDEMNAVASDAAEWAWRHHGASGLLRLLADVIVGVLVARLEELGQDLRYAARTLAATPGYTCVSVFSLALGIYGAASVSSTVNALILRDSPGVQSPDELISVRSLVPAAHFERYMARTDLFTSATAYIPREPVHIRVERTSERLNAHLIDNSYFRTMGIAPPNTSTSAPWVVISHGLWRDRFGSSPLTAGQTMRVNGAVRTVMAVAPAGFQGPSPLLTPADVWLPLPPERMVTGREQPAFAFVARLKPGVTHSTAEAELDALARQANRDLHIEDEALKGRIVQVVPGAKLVPVRKQNLPLLLSFPMIIVGAVLTIACANVANLMLARASERRREIAVRLALGASRWRVIRQLVTESTLLTFIAGIVAVAVTFVAMRLLSLSTLPSYMVKAKVAPGSVDFTPDAGVLMLVVALCLGTGLLLGLVPALHVTRTEIAGAMKTRRRGMLRNGFLLAQVTGSVALLLLTATLVTGFRRTAGTDLGFDVSRLYAVSLDATRDGKSDELYERLLRRMEGADYVEAATLTQSTPFSGQGSEYLRFVTDASAAGGATAHRIGANYFEVLRVPMRQGRTFRREESPDSAIVNQSFADRYAGLGATVRAGDRTLRIVGVAANMRSEFGMETPPPALFLPARGAGYRTLLVRTRDDRDVLARIQRDMAAVDAEVHLFDAHRLSERVDEQMHVLQFAAALHASEGALGLLLACIGLAGVTAYGVSRRTREIGIRVALGASQSRVLRLVMREGMVMVAAGATLGTAGAVVVTRLLASSFQAVALVTSESSLTPPLMLACGVILGLVALGGCYWPARHATRIDPAAALRQE